MTLVSVTAIGVRISPAVIITVLLGACTTFEAPGVDRDSAGNDARLAPSAAALGIPPLADPYRVRLTGLGQTQLDQLLGPPQFRRDDGPAQLLQYRSDSCVLDVFVYRDAEAADSRVAYVEARDHGLREISEPQCVASLLRSRSPQPAS